MEHRQQYPRASMARDHESEGTTDGHEAACRYDQGASQRTEGSTCVPERHHDNEHAHGSDHYVESVPHRAEPVSQPEAGAPSLGLTPTGRLAGVASP